MTTVIMTETSHYLVEKVEKPIMDDGVKILYIAPMEGPHDTMRTNNILKLCF